MRSIFSLCLVFIMQLFISCGDGTSSPSRSGDTTSPSGGTSQSLLIAPFIEGQFHCDDAVNNRDVKSEDDAALLCASKGKNGAHRISAVLDELGSAVSPSGKYQLGYTLNVPVFRYFKKVDGRWIFDQESLSRNLTTITDVDRPVVIFLSADHFAVSNSALTADLASDLRNLMWTRAGPL